MRRLWLAVFATLLCGSVHALNFSQIGGAGGGGDGVGLLTVKPSDLTNVTAAGDIPQADAAGADEFDSLTPYTTFFGFEHFASPDYPGDNSNTTFETSVASAPYYGKAKYSASASSETNCAYFYSTMPRSYASDVDLRIENFVVASTGTDSATQRYVVAITTSTDYSAATFSNPINVDLTASNEANDRTYIGSAVVLTGWKSVAAAGVPYIAAVCRDGNDGTNDASTTQSWLVRFDIRYGKTLP